MSGSARDQIKECILNKLRVAIDQGRYTFYENKEKNRKTLKALEYTPDDMAAAMKSLSIVDHTRGPWDEDGVQKWEFNNTIDGHPMYYRFCLLYDFDWITIESAHFDNMP